MLLKSVGVIVLTVCLSGCVTASLYPVSGPLAEKKQLMPLKATVYGVLGNSGSIKLTNTEGLVCEGEWSSAAGVITSSTSGNLMSQYGTTYFSGTSFVSGGGQNPGQAMVVCPDGNSFDIEFTTGGGTASGFGIAKDRKNNIFKVIF